jgi:membrane-associated phospholipid phosphatase
LDLPLARLCAENGLPGDIRKGLNLMEAYAHGIGVGLICLTVFVLDRSRRKYIWRLAACPIAGGLMGLLAKRLIARSRPMRFDLSQPIGESFGAWLPSWNVPGWDHPLQSFPSGHVATAVGLTVALVRFYPHGRPLFIAFAVLAACQRMGSSAHFLSDTLAGAAVGLFFAAMVFDPRFGGKIYDRLERS